MSTLEVWQEFDKYGIEHNYALVHLTDRERERIADRVYHRFHATLDLTIVDEHPVEPATLVANAQSAPVVAHTDPLTQLILDQNWKTSFIDGQLVIAEKGVVIHKIDETQGQAVADRVKAEAVDGFTVEYVLACLCIESVFDVQCQNGNFLGSNKAKDPCGYDVGVAQGKIRYLLGSNEIEDVFAAHAFLCDPSKAVPWFANKMREELAFADKLIPTLPATVNPVYKNRFAVSTLAYNFGDEGAEKMISENEPTPSHVLHVAHLEYAFAKTLGGQVLMPEGL